MTFNPKYETTGTGTEQEQKQRKQLSQKTLELVKSFFNGINNFEELRKTNKERILEVLQSMKEDGLTDLEAGDEIRELAKEAGIPQSTLRTWLPAEAKHQDFSNDKATDSRLRRGNRGTKTRTRTENNNTSTVTTRN